MTSIIATDDGHEIPTQRATESPDLGSYGRGAAALTARRARARAAEDAARVNQVLEKQHATLAPVWADLADWLREWPSPPDEPTQLRPWLHEFEVVGLAAQGRERVKIADEPHDAIARAFEQALAQAEATIKRRKDHARFAQESTQRTAELGRDVAPWCWIRAGEIREWLASEDTALREASGLWIDELLHAEDEAILEQNFPSNLALRHAYADVLRERLREVHLTRWTAAWSLDVARSLEDLELVRPELSVRLPHIDDAITVWLHEAGVFWRGPAGAEQEFTPATTTVHDYAIADLGDFQTRLVFHEPTSDQDVWHGLTSLRQVAGQVFTGRARADERLLLRGGQVVDAFIRAFEDGGILASALADGHQAFEQGNDTSPELERLVRYALESRLELSSALKSLLDAGLSVEQRNARLLKADDDLMGAASALQLMDEEDYLAATEGASLDLGAWWEARAQSWRGLYDDVEANGSSYIDATALNRCLRRRPKTVRR